ncbi:MATE family efflux transporter [Culicoidibacter larvae]|uniref:Multidrug export protein MepA n=1 Tax=Culicoidibacter larvae TaxID=2579976 RepID=A0A5R8QFH7_9FIRM|nr:MATE family efflux transporter [Culicoidibacter larvae]TLG76765.1 MATE family efflux transporter [Culicoidibacter larvae]
MNNDRSFLGKKPIGPLLAQMAAPMVVGFMVQAFYNLADTFFVGKTVGPVAIGALGIAFPLQMILMSIGQLVGSGSATQVSIHIGRKDIKPIRSITGSSFIFTIILSTTAVLISLLSLDILLPLFGSTPEFLPYAKEFMLYSFIGIPFFALSMFCGMSLRAEGKPKVQMINMLVSAVINIALDWLFVWQFNMGVAGAAIATSTAQIISCIVAMVFLFSPKSLTRPKMPQSFKQFYTVSFESLKLGLPLFFSTAATSAVAIVANNVLRFYGTPTDISVYATISKINSFAMMPVFGINNGMQPIIGYNFGSRQFDRVHKVYNMALRTTFIFLICVVAIVQFFPEQIIGIFVDSSDTAFIQDGVLPLRLFFSLTMFTAMQSTSMIALQSLGQKVSAMLISLSQQVILFIPMVLIISFILANIFGSASGTYGVWISFPLAGFIAGVFAFFFTQNKLRDLSKLQIKEAGREQELETTV